MTTPLHVARSVALLLPLALPPAKEKRTRHPDSGFDPLAFAAGHVLSIPVRHLYAALWRIGLIEVTRSARGDDLRSSIVH